MKINQTAAIVTGAASGMGEACARYLAELGAKVAVLDKNYDAALRVAKDINGLAIACDVSEAENTQSAIAMARDAHGVARICVNCAGIAPAKRVVGRDGPMPLSEFEKVMQVNLIGTFNTLRLAAADMMSLDPVDDSQERGIIINTASIAAYEGQIGQTAYSASKGGIVSLTLPAARELASFGIRVNTIAPGLIGTPMLLDMPEDVQASLASQVPFPKRFGKPSEFARLVAHIIENEMLNGTVIRLDGALRMPAR